MSAAESPRPLGCPWCGHRPLDVVYVYDGIGYSEHRTVDGFECSACDAGWDAGGEQTAAARWIEHPSLYPSPTSEPEPPTETPSRCEHRDRCGQRCLRPAGHPTTLDNWFTDGSTNAGHDYGGVASDSKRPAQWAAIECAAGGRMAVPVNQPAVAPAG